MPADLEPLPASAAAPGAGAGGLGEREQVLVSAWLTGLRSARTRRVYALM